MKRFLKIFSIFLVFSIFCRDVDIAYAANYRIFWYTLTVTGNRIQSTVPYYPSGSFSMRSLVNGLDKISGHSERAGFYFGRFYLNVTKTELRDQVIYRDQNWIWNEVSISNSDFSRMTTSGSPDAPLNLDYPVKFDDGVDPASCTLSWKMKGFDSFDLRGWTYLGAEGVKVYFGAVCTFGCNYYYNLGDVIDAIGDINIDISTSFEGVVDAVNEVNNSILKLDTDITNKIGQSTTQITNKIDQSTTQITNKIDQSIKQDADFRAEDIAQAEGFEVTGQKFVTDMQTTVKTKWAILFYPFEYSKQIIDVITNGTQSTYYKSYYNYVVGYHYDELTGGLLPILDFQQPRLDQRAGATIITFPAFTLPVLDLKIWDSFSFDLSTIKQQFPAVFNMMYLVAGIIETDLFVKFMRSKFDEVFGGDE